jgi:hypothetical protein
VAELTNLEAKLGEVMGLAQAGQEATRKVKTLSKEAGETAKRCNQVAGQDAKNRELRELVRWAKPIQQRHFKQVIEGSVMLAREEDPNETAS